MILTVYDPTTKQRKFENNIILAHQLRIRNKLLLHWIEY